MKVHYLEIVTNDVESVVQSYAKANSVEFNEPVAELGNAVTARLADDSLVGVRAPMHETEEPAIRPYWLVSDIEAALADCVAAGAEIAHSPLELAGFGTFAIYSLGGVMHGLWQL